jgi:chromosome segregation ATPase
MNAIGFFMRRLAWQFGIKQERARWSAVTRETQLLAEAQDLLGKLAWPSMERIEEMSGEYWQLKDLDERQAAMVAESERLEVENDDAQDRLYSIEEEAERDIEAIQGRRTELMEKAAEIMDGVEEVKQRDAETRRRFSSMKAKLEVLLKRGEEYGAEVEKTRSVLGRLRDEHAKDLEEITRRESDVERLEMGVLQIDKETTARRERLKAETTELVSSIGKRSKQIAELSARIGAVETKKGEISFVIGQYLGRHLDSRDAAVQEVLRPFRPIVGRIKDLRASIRYNQRLARRIAR